MQQDLNIFQFLEIRKFQLLEIDKFKKIIFLITSVTASTKPKNLGQFLKIFNCNEKSKKQLEIVKK